MAAPVLTPQVAHAEAPALTAEEAEGDPEQEAPAEPGPAEAPAPTERQAPAEEPAPAEAPAPGTELAPVAPLEGVGRDGQIASGSPGFELAELAERAERGGSGEPVPNLRAELRAGSASAVPGRGMVLGDDYPARYRSLPWEYPDYYIAQGLIWDEWNFAYRQCTSFVAWRLNSANGVPFSNQYGGIDRWGDAGQWGASARKLGIRVDTVPEVGAVAWSGPGYGGASEFGHVAWVSQVLDNGYVVVEEYNAGWAGSWGVRTVPANQFQGYIHVKDIVTAFADVGPRHKFFTEIEWMAATGKSTGEKQQSGPPRYFPQQSLSREAMAAFLFRMNGDKAYVAPADSPFADMQPNDKFYREITWMHEAGLATGTRQPSGKPVYEPKQAVTREAMAAFIYRMQKAKASSPATSPFDDVQRGDKFYKEIAWMQSEKLSTGYRQTTGKPLYKPREQVSREAVAAFLYRLENR